MSVQLKNLFSKPYQTVSAAQTAALAGGGDVLLDVRESHERQVGRASRARAGLPVVARSGGAGRVA